jgi:L-fuculose-phosphate aldolase
VVLRQIRAELVETLRAMAALGVVRGTEGNASARAGELVAISPSGLAYDTLQPEDVCVVTAGGELVEGPAPSVELPMHLAVYAARHEVGAVVHTHSPKATARPTVPVADAAGDGDAVVMRDHGPVCFGPDLAAALRRALELERSAT